MVRGTGGCRRCDELSKRLGIANAELARATARMETIEAGLGGNFDDSSSNFGDSSEHIVLRQHAQTRDVELAKSHVRWVGLGEGFVVFSREKLLIFF